MIQNQKEINDAETEKDLEQYGNRKDLHSTFSRAASPTCIPETPSSQPATKAEHPSIVRGQRSYFDYCIMQLTT